MIPWTPENQNMKFIIVGEGPAKDEVGKTVAQTGTPFLGYESKYMARMMRAAGVDWRDIAIVNVIDKVPPAGQFKRFPADVKEQAVKNLKTVLEKHKPNMVLALGQTAMWALTERTKLDENRGAVMPCTLVPGIKVLATYHPGFLIKGKSIYEPVVIHDIKKAYKESETAKIWDRERDIDIITDNHDAITLFEEYANYHKPVACDIETDGAAMMTAYGFATSKERAFTVTRNCLKNAEVLQALSVFCDGPVPKIFHNGLFDVFHGAYYWHLYTRNFFYDTMLAQHAIMPILPKSLGFCASIHTNLPSWKCLKPTAEVLTRQGWKQIQNINATDVVMVSTLDGQLYFDRVEKLRFPFAGTGIRIKNTNHDCWYTPNHRIPIESPYSHKRSVMRADRKYARTNIITAGNYTLGTKHCKFIRLLVAIQADAAIRFDRQKQVYFRLWKQRKIDRLLKLCSELGVEVRKHNANDGFSCELKGPVIDAIVAMLGPNKDFGMWLFDYDAGTLNSFIEELAYWDGWHSYDGEALYYSSNNYNNIKIVSTIAHCCGYTSHIMYAAGAKLPNSFKVSMRQTEHITCKREHITNEFYEGDVYCLKTNPGFFLCRNNGHVFITGNSEGHDVFKDIAAGKFYNWDDFYMYNAKDCCATYEIYEALEENIDYYHVRPTFDLMMNLGHVFLRGMLAGMRVDMDKVKSFADENEKAIAILEYIKEQTIGDINLRSPKQKSDLLYKQWKMPVQKIQGKVTTNRMSIEKLECYPTPYKPHLGLINTYMDYTKRRDFYNIKRDPDGRVRTSLKVHGAYTGRVSSSTSITGSGQNLQNIPKSARAFYVPDPGKIFIQMDLSQAEARVVAALCKDEEWLNQFNEMDLHTWLASRLFDIPMDKVRKKVERQVAKKVGHACNYCLGWATLAKQLKCSAKEAKAHIAQYHNVRTSVRPWHDRVKEMVDRDRAIRTPYGRLIQFPGPVSDKTYRDAVAAEPQSTSSDYLNTALCRMYNEGPEDFEFYVPVHDSILWQVPANVDAILRNVEAMKEFTEVVLDVHGIPLLIPCDFEIGYSWAPMTELKDISRNTIENVFYEVTEKYEASK